MLQPAKKIWNEGRVVGYSAYELFVKHAKNNNVADADIPSFQEWMTSTLGPGASILVKVAQTNSDEQAELQRRGWYTKDIELTGADVVAANPIFMSLFDGDGYYQSDNNVATAVTDYGALVANLRTLTDDGIYIDGPTTSETWSNAIVPPIRSDVEISRSAANSYSNIVNAVVLQPGSWRVFAAENRELLEAPACDYKYISTENPVLRLRIIGSITQDLEVLLTGLVEATMCRSLINDDLSSVVYSGSDSLPEVPFDLNWTYTQGPNNPEADRFTNIQVNSETFSNRVSGLCGEYSFVYYSGYIYNPNVPGFMEVYNGWMLGSVYWQNKVDVSEYGITYDTPQPGSQHIGDTIVVELQSGIDMEDILGQFHASTTLGPARFPWAAPVIIVPSSQTESDESNTSKSSENDVLHIESNYNDTTDSENLTRPTILNPYYYDGNQAEVGSIFNDVGLAWTSGDTWKLTGTTSSSADDVIVDKFPGVLSVNNTARSIHSTGATFSQATDHTHQIYKISDKYNLTRLLNLALNIQSQRGLDRFDEFNHELIQFKSDITSPPNEDPVNVAWSGELDSVQYGWSLLIPTGTIQNMLDSLLSNIRHRLYTLLGTADFTFTLDQIDNIWAPSLRVSSGVDDNVLGQFSNYSVPSIIYVRRYGSNWSSNSSLEYHDNISVDGCLTRVGDRPHAGGPAINSNLYKNTAYDFDTLARSVANQESVGVDYLHGVPLNKVELIWLDAAAAAQSTEWTISPQWGQFSLHAFNTSIADRIEVMDSEGTTIAEWLSWDDTFSESNLSYVTGSLATCSITLTKWTSEGPVDLGTRQISALFDPADATNGEPYRLGRSTSALRAVDVAGSYVQSRFVGVSGALDNDTVTWNYNSCGIFDRYDGRNNSGDSADSSDLDTTQHAATSSHYSDFDPDAHIGEYCLYNLPNFTGASSQDINPVIDCSTFISLVLRGIRYFGDVVATSSNPLSSVTIDAKKFIQNPFVTYVATQPNLYSFQYNDSDALWHASWSDPTTGEIIQISTDSAELQANWGITYFGDPQNAEMLSITLDSNNSPWIAYGYDYTTSSGHYTWDPRNITNLYGHDGWEFKEIDQQPAGRYNDIGISGYSSLRTAADIAEFFCGSAAADSLIIYDHPFVSPEDCARSSINNPKLNNEKVWSMIQPGDIIFWAQASGSEFKRPSRFRHISHVAMVSRDVMHTIEVTAGPNMQNGVYYRGLRYVQAGQVDPTSSSTTPLDSTVDRLHDITLIVRPRYKALPLSNIDTYNWLTYPWTFSRSQQQYDVYVGSGLVTEFSVSTDADSNINIATYSNDPTGQSNYTITLVGRTSSSSSSKYNFGHFTLPVLRHRSWKLSGELRKVVRTDSTNYEVPEVSVFIDRYVEDGWSHNLKNAESSGSHWMELTWDSNASAYQDVTAELSYPCEAVVRIKITPPEAGSPGAESRCKLILKLTTMDVGL